MSISINGSTGISGVNGSAATPAIQGGDSDTGIFFGTDTASIATGGNTRVHVDSSGRLLVGTSSAVAPDGTNYPAFQVSRPQSSGLNASALIREVEASTSWPILYINKNRASNSMQADNKLGSIDYYGDTGSSDKLGARIEAAAEATWTTSSHPTRLVFSTCASGSPSPTERLKIINNGRLDVYSSDAGAWGQFARNVRFGYGNPYTCLMLGGNEATTYHSISLGYNVANNSSGLFSGDGREVVVKNNARIISPNATDDSFAYNLAFNQGAHGTIATQGLLFGSDTAAGNTLDDYEEGEFTPTLTTANSSGTISWNNTTGYYVKAGNMCTASFYSSTMNITNNGSAHAIITGLPFVSFNDSNHYPVVHFTHVNAFQSNNVSGFVSTGTANIYPLEYGSVNQVNWTTGNPKYLMFSVTYRTN